jgi:hypothetical protein
MQAFYRHHITYRELLLALRFEQLTTIVGRNPALKCEITFCFMNDAGLQAGLMHLHSCEKQVLLIHYAVAVEISACACCRFQATTNPLSLHR